MTPSPYDQLNAIADRLERERNEARAERDQLQEENGRLRALMTTCGDCTERDRYRAALEDAEAALRAIQRETTYFAAFAIAVRYFADRTTP